MLDIKNRIKELARIYHSETIAFRRHIHANPELSGEEKKTSEFISSKLNQMNVSHKTGIGGYGIVAHIYGNGNNNKCVALRADMDALPIKENNEVPYKSGNFGVMHACGHDAHSAALLGTARILSELKDDFDGIVKLIFQPSEEKFPGGALAMIKEGALTNPEPQYIFGAHVFPDLEIGNVGTLAGPYMASTDEIYLTVKGKGGHAATPHKNIDPVAIASQIVVNLQQVVSRKAHPATPTVLSFGRFIAEGKTNIIPHEATLQGTFRTFDEEWRAKAHQHITAIAENTANAYGATCEVTIDKGYPVLENNLKAVEIFMTSAKELLGTEKVHTLEQRLTAEDFSYFTKVKPACFYRIGTANLEKGITANLHTPEFNIDEKSLEIATALLATVAINSLSTD